MSEPETETIDALVEAFLTYLQLPLDDAYRAGIVMHLIAAHNIAAPLLAFDLDDDTEPAPVFVA